MCGTVRGGVGAWGCNGGVAPAEVAVSESPSFEAGREPSWEEGPAAGSAPLSKVRGFLFLSCL